MKRELEEKRLAVTYSGQELNDTQHRLRSLEGKVNQLHAQNIQLSVKVEELKTKYEGTSRKPPPRRAKYSGLLCFGGRKPRSNLN